MGAVQDKQLKAGIKAGVKSAFSDAELVVLRAEQELKYPDRLFPKYFTGARAVLLVNGKRVGAAMNVSWSVNIEHEEIRTIDSQLPWELVPGQITIKAALSRIMDPDRTAASDGLFTTITAALHTPTAGLEIRDRLGNIVFYAKGSFTAMDGQVSNGALGIESLKFTGYYWKQNDIQEFDPLAGDDDIATRTGKKLKSLFTNNSLVGRVSSLA